MRGEPSYAEAAKGHGLQQQEDSSRPESNTDNEEGAPVRSSESSEPIRPVWKQVRHLEHQLEKLQKDNERILAESKREHDSHLSEAREQVAAELEKMKVQVAHDKKQRAGQIARQKKINTTLRKQVAEAREERKEMKAHVAREQQKRADERVQLRKANVMLKGKDQELHDVLADRDRFQAMVQDSNTARLLAGGINIQAAFPTLPEIETRIRRALTATVSEWIEEATPVWSHAGSVPVMLSRVFLECREMVDGVAGKLTWFMEGGIRSDGEIGETDEATVDLFRQHVRRHHRTLFPLTGEHLQNACRNVADKLIVISPAPSFPGLSPATDGKILMLRDKLCRVVAEYLPIMVGATLQNPALIFAEDCGQQQLFNSTIHAESIDGDALDVGQQCLVVFPALLVKSEGDQGFRRVTKSYILPVSNYRGRHPVHR
eukprot:g12526.t1